MINTLATYWPIITSLTVVVLALIRLYISHHDLKRDVAEIKRTHKVDMQAAADARKDDVIKIYTEIDDPLRFTKDRIAAIDRELEALDAKLIRCLDEILAGEDSSGDAAARRAAISEEKTTLRTERAALLKRLTV